MTTPYNLDRETINDLLERYNQDVQEFVEDPSSMPDIEGAVYQGFNQELVRMVGNFHFSTKSLMMISLVGALRGAKKAKTDVKLKQIVLEYRKTPQDSYSMHSFEQCFSNKYLNDEKNSNANLSESDLTVQRITHSFPELACFALHKLNEAGKLTNRVETTLSPAFQFPAAASLPLTSAGAEKVKEFCKKFSELLVTKKDGKEVKGTFNESIFNQQRGNVIKSRITNKLAEIYPEFIEAHILDENDLPDISKMGMGSFRNDDTESSSGEKPRITPQKFTELFKSSMSKAGDGHLKLKSDHKQVLILKEKLKLTKEADKVCRTIAEIQMTYSGVQAAMGNNLTFFK